MPLRTRPPRPEDAEAIARIYNQGIAGRLATLETRERTARTSKPGSTRYSLVVVEDAGGTVLCPASAPPYRAHRDVYRGVGDFSVYVAGEARGRGAGRVAMEALAAEARAFRGFWKYRQPIFPENEASLALCRSLGFREVGVYRRHARLDGVWRGCGRRRASARWRRLGRQQADLDALGQRLQVAWVERLDAADARHGLYEPARAHEDRRHPELRADEPST